MFPHAQRCQLLLSVRPAAVTPQQIEVIRQWIREGAEWQPHWAYVAPRRPAVPAVQRPERSIWSAPLTDLFL